jgi:hypothetical protein
MVSYRVGFSEFEHRRASNGQHIRKRFFNDSFPACQGQKRANFGRRHLGKSGLKSSL